MVLWIHIGSLPPLFILPSFSCVLARIAKWGAGRLSHCTSQYGSYTWYIEVWTITGPTSTVSSTLAAPLTQQWQVPLLGFHLGMCTWEHICPKVPFWSSQSYLKENCGLAYSSENKTQACVCLILHKTHAFCTQMRLDTNDTVVPFKLWTPAMLWIVFGVCKALQPSALARIYVALFITLRSQRKMLL